MRKVRLGKTGMMVSELGLGGIPIQRVASDEEAVLIIRRCLDLGINYIDTAADYTTSEGRIGKAIAGRRNGLFLSTKSKKRTREGVQSDLENSLKKLGVDYIDLYQFHNVTSHEALKIVLAPDGPIVAAEKAKAEGLIKHIGVTSHSAVFAKELIESGRFETIMSPLNFVACETAEDILPIARKHDVGFIAMKPMGGGRLDNATLAFKFLFQYPDVVPLIGIQGINEIEEIIQIYSGSRILTETERLEIEEFKQSVSKNFCHRCEYCQPCPQKIPISVMMSIESFVKRMPLEHIFEEPASSRLEKVAECLKCGKCEERCPYHLSIRETLAENYKWFREAKIQYQKNHPAK
jgi:predicted aldo/keto reductase-like oxidoreductase